MKSLLIITALVCISCLSVAEASEADHNRGLTVNNGTHNWKTFVVHIREGEVDELTQNVNCRGRDKKGKLHSGGCARWRPTPPGAMIDGECWITIPKWNIANSFTILYTWGHELAHCVKGAWH